MEQRALIEFMSNILLNTVDLQAQFIAERGLSFVEQTYLSFPRGSLSSVHCKEANCEIE